MTSSLADGPWTSGRPERGLSNRPGTPSLANRFRHVLTVDGRQPRSRAICGLSFPSSAARMILARSASRCGLVAAFTICSSLRRR